MYDANDKYPFAEISLANPHGIQGGAFFSKIRLKGDSPFLFQTPKCLTKNGIVQTDKKIYCDLAFSENNDVFINFLQDLEKNIQHLIYEKRNLWFHNDMEMENIEYFFNPLIRNWKKSLVVRTYVQQPRHIKSMKSLQIYDENENRLTIKDVSKDKKVIAIIEGLGIKFTSSSFHLELCLRQLMLLDDKPIFNKCLIQMESPHYPNEGDTSSSIYKMNYDEHIAKDKIINSAEQKEGENETAKEEENTEDVLPLIKTEKTLEGEIKNIDNQKENTDEKSQIEDNEEPSAKSDNEDGDDDDDEPEDSFTLNCDTDIDTDNESGEDTIATEEGDDTPAIPQIREKDISQNKIAPPSSFCNKTERTLEKKAQLHEVNVDLPENSESVRLKDPVEVYKEIYSKALEKAKQARRLAVQAFLEAKHIKNTFLSGEIDDSDEEYETLKEEMSG